MNSIAKITGIITKLTNIVELNDGNKVRNLVLCCELHNAQNTLVFHDVLLWNNLCEIAVKKNMKVAIEGQLKYKNKDGNKYAEIIAAKMEIIQ